MEGFTFLPVTGSNWDPMSKRCVYAMAKGLQTASRVPAFTSLVTTIPRPLPANGKGALLPRREAEEALLAHIVQEG